MSWAAFKRIGRDYFGATERFKVWACLGGYVNAFLQNERGLGDCGLALESSE